MYANAKKGNIIPERKLHRKNITANQLGISNCYGLSKNDLRIQYRPQSKTTSNVIQRMLFIDGKDAKEYDLQKILKEGFDRNNVYYYEQIINYLNTCEEKFELDCTNLDAFVLCIKKCLRDKMGKLRENFIQKHMESTSQNTPSFILKRETQDALVAYEDSKSLTYTPIDAYTDTEIAIVGGGNKNEDLNYIARIAELAKASERIKAAGNSNFKGYVCCAIFSEQKLREGELEAIIKAKQKIENMRLNTEEYANCGITIFCELPDFKILLKTCKMEEVQKFIDYAKNYEVLSKKLSAIGYNPNIPLTDIRNCLDAYKIEEPETELTDDFGSLFV